MNQKKYPEAEYHLSFHNQQCSRAYRDSTTFSEKFYGMNELITQRNITPADYKDLYPMFVFDLSKQAERIKTSVVDIQIKAVFDAAPPAGTNTYAIVISDKLLTFESDGNKINVVYK